MPERPHEVYAVRQTGSSSRIPRAIIAAAAVLAAVAAAALVATAGSHPAVLSTQQLWGRDDAYVGSVFPAYQDARLAGVSHDLSRLAYRETHRDSSRQTTFVRKVFPTYGAFMNDGDESGRGQTMLHRAQHEADQWMRDDQRDWTGSGAEYLSNLPKGQQLAGAPVRVTMVQAPVSVAAASPIRAQVAAQALLRPVEMPTAPQKLYIPAMYNDKIDQKQEMEDMMNQFQDIIQQITDLQTQMECAASCSNSSVNSTGLNLDSMTLDVTFDDSHKNVSGGILSPAEDDAVAMACLSTCGIDASILNSTMTAEASTRNKLSAILMAIGAEKSKMQAIQFANVGMSAPPPLQSASMAVFTKPTVVKVKAAESGETLSSKASALKKFSDSWFGHDAAHARVVRSEMKAANAPIKAVATIDTAVVSRSRLVKATDDKVGTLHSYAYQATLAKSDTDARAWAPPPKPDFATRTVVRAQAKARLNVKATAALEESAGKLGDPFAQLAITPRANSYMKAGGRALPARQQLLMQINSHSVESRRHTGASNLRKWLGGRKVSQPTSVELIDWTVDLEHLSQPAGSFNTATGLTPPRDSVRHTTGIILSVCASVWRVAERVFVHLISRANSCLCACAFFSGVCVCTSMHACMHACVRSCVRSCAHSRMRSCMPASVRASVRGICICACVSVWYS